MMQWKIGILSIKEVGYSFHYLVCNLTTVLHLQISCASCYKIVCVVEWTLAYLSLLHLVFVSSFFVLQFFFGAIDENSPVYIRPIIYVSLYTGAKGMKVQKEAKALCWVADVAQDGCITVYWQLKSGTNIG